VDVVDLLDFDLGREPVTVPALREEDGVALEASVARDEVDVRPAERVAEVEVPRGVRRRRVDDVLGVRLVGVEAVDVAGLPLVLPLGFDAVGVVAPGALSWIECLGVPGSLTGSSVPRLAVRIAALGRRNGFTHVLRRNRRAYVCMAVAR